MSKEEHAKQGKTVEKHKKSLKQSKEEEEEITIDFSKIKKAFTNISNVKFKQQYLTIGLILVALFLSVYFRMYPQWLPITDDWARQSLENSVKAQISAQISQQTPFLPEDQKREIINERFQEFYKANKQAFEEQVRQTSQYFKQRMKYEYDNKSTTYLLAIDPYTYYRLTRNILRHGHVGDVIKNGKEWDALMVAPLGVPTHASFHVYAELLLYKVFNFFGDFDLMHTCFYLPIIVSALAVFPAFFIAKRFGGNVAGFIAAVIAALHPAFIGRTAGGFADTDAYNVVFPLWITWLFLEALESKKTKKTITLAISSGILLGVYSFAWAGWWYIFDFLIATTLMVFAWIFVKNVYEAKTKNIVKRVAQTFSSKEFLNTLTVLLCFILVGGLTSFALTHNLQSFIKAPLQPLFFTTIKEAAHKNLWPNVYTTVAELNPASIKSALNTISFEKPIYFLIASLGLLLTVIGVKKKLSWKVLTTLAASIVWYLLLFTNLSSVNIILWALLYFAPLLVILAWSLKERLEGDVKLALLLFVWIVSTLYASTKGVRFTMLMVPAFALALGIGFGALYSLTKKYLSANLNIPTTYSALLLLIIIASLLVMPLKAINTAAKQEVPSMTDAWFETLTAIKNNSSENAIITSWWDFGHWFKAIAERPVTFDGGSQNSPMAHWVGKLLLTNNESLAIGILRMLDCGSNQAFEILNDYNKDTLTTIKQLNKILTMDKDQARQFLAEQGVPEAIIEKVLNKTHCKPPEAFLITSEDMVGKAGVWGHFGSWNFARAWAYLNVKGKPAEKAIPMLKEKLNSSQEQATNMYYEIQSLSSEKQANDWIAPWPNYLTQQWKPCTRKNQTLTCVFNAIIARQPQADLVLEKAVIDLANNTVTASMYFINKQGLRSNPQQASFKKLVIAKGEELTTITYKNATLNLAVVLDADFDRVLITAPELADSMFTRLFYLDGAGTKHFEKFSDKTTFTGLRIIVWKVKW